MIASTQTHHPFVGPGGKPTPTSELLAQVAERIHAAGGRVTKPRIAMLSALVARGHPVTIEQIHRDVGVDRCDLVTIYRSMAAFEELGVVRRSFFHDGTVLYEIILNQPARYHVLCKATNQVVQLDPETAAELHRSLEAVQRKLRARGFASVTHRVEFFGVSPDAPAPAKLAKT